MDAIRRKRKSKKKLKSESITSKMPYKKNNKKNTEKNVGMDNGKNDYKKNGNNIEKSFFHSKNNKSHELPTEISSSNEDFPMLQATVKVKQSVNDIVPQVNTEPDLPPGLIINVNQAKIDVKDKLKNGETCNTTSTTLPTLIHKKSNHKSSSISVTTSTSTSDESSSDGVKTAEVLLSLGIKFKTFEEEKAEKRIEEITRSTSRSPENVKFAFEQARNTSPNIKDNSSNINKSQELIKSNSKLRASSPHFVPSHLQEKDVPLNVDLKNKIKYIHPQHLTYMRQITHFDSIICIYHIIPHSKANSDRGKDYYPKYDYRNNNYVGYILSNNTKSKMISSNYILTFTTRESVEEFFKKYPQFIVDVPMSPKKDNIVSKSQSSNSNSSNNSSNSSNVRRKICATITRNQNMLKLSIDKNSTNYNKEKINSVILEFETELFCESFYYVIDELKFDLNALWS